MVSYNELVFSRGIELLDSERLAVSGGGVTAVAMAVLALTKAVKADNGVCIGNSGC